METGDLKMKIFEQNKIIPVVVIENADDILPLTEALISGGINIIEITLRTEAALDAIKIAKEQTDIIVGAGTIISEENYEQVIELGVDFIVSPGLTKNLVGISQNYDTPYIPGVSTPTEIMRAKKYGCSYLKFFPAEISGGVKALKQFSLFDGVKFCPTGGVNKENYQEYLDLPNVFAIGGTWIAPKELIDKKDWNKIADNAKLGEK